MPTKKQLQPRDVEQQIRERLAYLKQIERDIEQVTLAGSDKIRVVQGEIDQLESEKARLMTVNFGLEQQIRENRVRLAKVSL